MTDIADATDNSFISFETGNSNSRDKDLNLNKLVHLALSSSPQLGGIVNFNILKTFLLELLKALNLQSYELKLSGDDNELINQNLVNNNLTDNNNNNNNNNHLKQPIIINQERFHVLEDKVNRFEQQLAALNSLPSNQNIIDKSKQRNGGGPVLEIWQYTQISKRLESNEEGITKLTSLLQDLINEINDLKENQSKHDKDFENINNQLSDLMRRFEQIEQFKDALVMKYYQK